MDPITVIIAIVVTFFCYMVVPFLYKISHTGTIDAKQANRFAIVNSVVVFLILLLILAAIDASGLATVKYISVGPAFLYYLINQAYLKHQAKSKQQGESQIPNVPPPVYQPQNKESMTAPMQAPKPNAPLYHAVMKRSDEALPAQDLEDDNETLLQKAFNFLRAEQWQSAFDYSETVLERDYSEARAYICELLAELRLKEETMLGTLERDPNDFEKFRFALRSADDGYRQTLENYAASAIALSKQKRSEAIYRTGVARKNAARTEADFLRAAEVFETIEEFSDAQAQATECRNRAHDIQQAAKEKREQAVLRDKKTAKILLGVGLFVTVSLLLGFFVIRPAIIYNQAQDALSAGNYQDAGTDFAKNAWYKDSYDQAMMCGNTLQTNGQYTEAIVVFDAIPSRFPDAQTQASECRYIMAMSLMDQGNYSEAYPYLLLLQGYKDGEYAQKYCYVQLHRSKDDATTMNYLKDLTAAQYRDSSAIYFDVTKWTVSVVANRYASDSVSSVSTVSKYDTWYFHMNVAGGPPNGAIELYYKVTYPDKATYTGTYSGGYDGAKCYLECGYSGFQQYGTTGNCTITVYNNATNEVIGTGSVRITN
ncbi:MAG: hypothetical protein ACC608_01525 [Anaerofustis sp.]